MGCTGWERDGGTERPFSTSARPLFVAGAACYASSTMNPARSRALWLATAIVMIAATLMSSGAQAHEGHPHDGRIAALTDIAAQPTPELGASLERRLSADLSAHAVSAVSAVIDASHLACACPACASGGACGHAPSSCCATGLPPAAAAGLMPPARCDRAPARDGPFLSGIVPEAQTEPPKPFA